MTDKTKIYSVRIDSELKEAINNLSDDDKENLTSEIKELISNFIASKEYENRQCFIKSIEELSDQFLSLSDEGKEEFASKYHESLEKLLAEIELDKALAEL